MGQKLYVGNLPYSVTEDTLRELFASYGEVQSVTVITDRDTGQPRGFGFVEMENASEAMAGLDGRDLEADSVCLRDLHDFVSAQG